MLGAVIQRQEDKTMAYKTLTVPLGKDEFHALRAASDREYRHPRDQARHLLRCALGLDSSQKDINSIYQTDFEQKEAV